MVAARRRRQHHRRRRHLAVRRRPRAGWRRPCSGSSPRERSQPARTSPRGFAIDAGAHHPQRRLRWWRVEPRPSMRGLVLAGGMLSRRRSWPLRRQPARSATSSLAGPHTTGGIDVVTVLAIVAVLAAGPSRPASRHRFRGRSGASYPWADLQTFLANTLTPGGRHDGVLPAGTRRAHVRVLGLRAPRSSCATARRSSSRDVRLAPMRCAMRGCAARRSSRCAAAAAPELRLRGRAAARRDRSAHRERGGRCDADCEPATPLGRALRDQRTARAARRRRTAPSKSFLSQLALLLDAAALLERTVAVERSLAHAEKLAAIRRARRANRTRDPEPRHCGPERSPSSSRATRPRPRIPSAALILKRARARRRQQVRACCSLRAARSSGLEPLDRPSSSG